jgi:hypothetical protein
MAPLVSLSGVFIAPVHKMFNISELYPLEGDVQVMELLLTINGSFHRPRGAEVRKVIFRIVCSLRRNLLNLLREKFQTVTWSSIPAVLITAFSEDGCRATFCFHHDVNWRNMQERSSFHRNNKWWKTFKRNSFYDDIHWRKTENK